jgi:hypothetical protein
VGGNVVLVQDERVWQRLSAGSHAGHVAIRNHASYVN